MQIEFHAVTEQCMANEAILTDEKGILYMGELE